MKSKISIIVPIYKVEAYIGRCIESVLNQTYRNIELILVDDGSPDKCGEICEKYARKDSRIIVIHKENGGLSDARNAGIDIATGEYIGFVDSDDFIHPEMYSILYNNMIEQKADISICQYKSVTDSTIDLCALSKCVKTYSNIDALAELFTFASINFVLAWNKLYKAELFEDIRYPKGKIREDEFTTHKIIFKSKKIVYTDSQLYYYRQTPNSIMREQSLKKEILYAEAMEEKLQFYLTHSLLDFYILGIRRYCLWLLNTYATNYKLLKIEPGFKEMLLGKSKLYLTKVIQSNSITARTKSFYRFAKFYPYLGGLIAYQKLYRYNKISRAFDYLFSEPSLYKP